MEPTTSPNKAIPILTIAATIDMFTGIVLLAIGYFQQMPVLFYVGIALTLAGVMVQMVVGILGRKGQQQR